MGLGGTGSKKWVIWVIIIILIIAGVWYYTGGDLSVITDKLGGIKDMLPGTGE